MRTWNEEIGESIVNIINFSEPEGIRFNELLRRSGYAKNTLTRWLVRLRDTQPQIVKKLPIVPIHLTEFAIKGLKNGNLVIPIDPNRKKIEKNQRNRIKKIVNPKIETIALILCLAAFGVDKYRIESGLGSIIHKDPLNKDRSYCYKTQLMDGVSIEDITYKFFNIRNNQPQKKTSFPENKINMSNDELFGYVRLSKNDGIKLIDFLVKHNPPIINPIGNNYINNIVNIQTRYKIKDKLLEDFIKKCILAYNMDVSERLKYAYIYKLLNKMHIDQYKKWMKKLYGHKRKITELFDHMEYEKNYLKNKCIDTISSLKNLYLEYIQECDKDIFDYGLFEKDIKKEKVNGEYEYKLNICKKYKNLYQRYPSIINAFFNLFFPNFLREIWYYQK